MDSLPAIISGGAFGGGTLANIIEGSKENSYRNKILALLNNPAQLQALVAKLQQPLNNGLTQAVGNRVQGDLAERGLGQAPGVFAASESQALAPFYQENQNSALQAVMQLLGMPAGTFKNPVNNSGALSAFLKYLPGQQQPQGDVWNGGSVGGIADPALGQIQYMPQNFPTDWPQPPTDGGGS